MIRVAPPLPPPRLASRAPPSFPISPTTATPFSPSSSSSSSSSSSAISPSGGGDAFDLDRVHDACRRGHASSVRDAIGANKSVVNKTGAQGYTALHWAAATGHISIVELLLHSGANVNAVTLSGDTALHLAAWKHHPLVIALLLQDVWRAHVDIKNNDGKRAEDLARSDEIRDCFAKPSSDMIRMMPEEEYDDDDEE